MPLRAMTGLVFVYHPIEPGWPSRSELGNQVFLFRDDFRRCSDSEDYPLNLMVFSGLPQHGWQNYLYGSIAELADPSKALMRWVSLG
jgi:hypothetical protein